jgi:hypothetical protein
MPFIVDKWITVAEWQSDIETFCTAAETGLTSPLKDRSGQCLVHR